MVSTKSQSIARSKTVEPEIWDVILLGRGSAARY